MLRLAVIVLLLANALYYAWSQGLLRALGAAPQQQSEPQRLQQQIRPETLQVLKAGPADGADPGAVQPAGAQASAAQPSECLQAGPFDAAQTEALRAAAAAALPPGSWLLDATPLPARWMVYMGRFDDADALARKRNELRAYKIDVDRAGGALDPGLSLGRFASEEAARRELAHLAGKGVRTARVIRERAEAPGFTLRLPAVGDTLRPQLNALRGAMAGKTLRACG